jgi:hypothetical protein
VVVEKTEFKVKLEAFDAANKVALIRAVKDIVKDLNLIAVSRSPTPPHTQAETSTQTQRETCRYPSASLPSTAIRTQWSK